MGAGLPLVRYLYVFGGGRVPHGSNTTGAGAAGESPGETLPSSGPGRCLTAAVPTVGCNVMTMGGNSASAKTGAKNSGDNCALLHAPDSTLLWCGFFLINYALPSRDRMLLAAHMSADSDQLMV